MLRAAWSQSDPQSSPDAAAVRFEKLCYSCHNIGGGDKKGPDLQGVTERRSREWLHRFIVSPKEVKDSGDATARELFAKYRPEEMPDQVLSPAEIDEILNLIEQYTAGGKTFIPTSGKLSRQPEARDIPIGRALFTGQRRISAGIPACISCHGATGIGPLGGGSLGPDLTNAAAKYTDVELASIMKAPAFPVMASVFGGNELSDEEVVQLYAYLLSVKPLVPDTAAASFSYMLVAGLGLVLLFGFTHLLWRNRLRDVRKEITRKRS
jgi:mono/diheme cytochrome c family protein